MRIYTIHPDGEAFANKTEDLPFFALIPADTNEWQCPRCAGPGTELDPLIERAEGTYTIGDRFAVRSCPFCCYHAERDSPYQKALEAAFEDWQDGNIPSATFRRVRGWGRR